MSRASLKRTSIVETGAAPGRMQRNQVGYRLDIIVENAVILELKCVEQVLPVHEAQLLTYLKMTHKRVGLILNFNAAVLTHGGIVRKVI